MKATTISTDVLAVLSASTFDGPNLRLTGTLDRRMYQQVNQIIEAAGGKWNRKAGAHVFDGEASEIMEPIIMIGEIVRPQDLGQFDTPDDVAARVIDLANIKPGMQILEPSAGLGNLVVEAISRGGIVTTYEIDPRRAAALTIRISKLNAPAAADCSGYFKDFLTAAPEPAFDRVIMNPPFAPSQADIDHVLHARRFLKQGGRLVSVMADGIMYRENRKSVDFRRMLEVDGAHYERLPEGSFKISGTAVKTCIVAFDA